MPKSKHQFHEKLESAGHTLILDEHGEVDIFVLEYGNHNGPGCSKCGESWCHHCGGEVRECSARKEAPDAE